MTDLSDLTPAHDLVKCADWNAKTTTEYAHPDLLVSTQWATSLFIAGVSQSGVEVLARIGTMPVKPQNIRCIQAAAQTPLLLLCEL
jgi:hypothetical protein